MANVGGSPRNINLNLPGDYFSVPTTRFVEWLEANTASLRLLSEGPSDVSFAAWVQGGGPGTRGVGGVSGGVELTILF